MAATAKPNVLVILADDQGWGDLSVSGNTQLSTPHIDSLASAGARFDRFYVCPVCSPTRAEFLTGRYHPRSGVYSTSEGGERMNLDEHTIAEAFATAGYATGAFGKWHNGMQYPYHPNGRGFQEFYGFCSGHWGHYFSPLLEHNGQLVQGDGFVTDDFTNKAISFIDKAKQEQKPFFAYLPYNTPHSPMQVPDQWWDKFKDKDIQLGKNVQKNDLDHARCALAMCENIDWNVGRLLAHLDSLGIAENTIVLYFSDNGPNAARWNGGMKGIKGSTDEGGVRSPLVIRWPGKIRPGLTITENGAAIDLLPTLAELAGIELVGFKPLDGVSLKPLLLGTTTRLPERLIFSHWSHNVSVKFGSYRLDNAGKLFDLSVDPGQKTDLSLKNPDLTKHLQQAVTVWRKDVLAGYDKDKRPFMIGHPDYRFTQIPARDGEAHGTIKRSNRFPNCTYFEHWTSVNDSITWKAEVGESGRYEVELHYTCPKKSIGTELELSFGEAKLAYTITEAHDPPERGAAEDRVPRQESYIKDFKAVRMGIIQLTKGPGELKLRASKIPGEEAIDFRLLMLTRVK